MEETFLKQDCRNISISDLNSILRCFYHEKSKIENFDKVLDKIVALTFESIKSSDQHMLDLYRLLHKIGVLDK